mmetsp:Transcript_64880/g.107860  ORF Transcript_64880/g.107860 Transcript_64880/m.107860 type:complete len:207 (+) Transcript_64880:380-1000(+)
MSTGGVNAAKSDRWTTCAMLACMYFRQWSSSSVPSYRWASSSSEQTVSQLISSHSCCSHHRSNRVTSYLCAAASNACSCAIRCVTSGGGASAPSESPAPFCSQRAMATRSASPVYRKWSSALRTGGGTSVIVILRVAASLIPCSSAARKTGLRWLSTPACTVKRVGSASPYAASIVRSLCVPLVSIASKSSAIVEGGTRTFRTVST